MLDVAIPAAVDPVAVVPEIVEGITIVHDDDALVVIDKPVGVAVHPSPGWTGPTVVGHLVAAGFRISTSGAAERQGIVQRLDVGTSGVMVIAKSERGLLRAQERVPPPHGRQDLPRAGAGPPRPAAGHHRRPDRPAPQARLQVRGDAPTARPASPTTRRSRRTGSPACSRSTSRPAAPTRSGCTWPRSSTPASATSPTAPTRRWPRGSGLTRQWLHAVRLGFEHPESGEYVEYESTYPADLQHALDALRDAV